jgi:hypothetical protein
MRWGTGPTPSTTSATSAGWESSAELVGLTVAVMILATDSDELGAGTRGPLPAQLPNTGYDGGSEEGTRGPVSLRAPITRYDNGPDEGTPLSGSRP